MMQAWQNFLVLQEAELGIETVSKWLRTLKVVRFDACNVYLEAKDSFQALWFEEHIRKKLQTKLLNNNNKKIKVHLTVANSPAPIPKQKSKIQKNSASPSHAAKFSLTFEDLDPFCTFDHFVVSENNLLTLKVLSKMSGYDLLQDSSLKEQSPELGMFNPIYLHGVSGTGKTHLLMALAKAFEKHHLKVIYSRAEKFTEHLVAAIRAGEMSVFRQTYRNIDVLILDDVHFFSRKGATQEELFHTFNTLHLAGKQIILSANCPPSELSYIEPRLVSRFEWGITLSLDTLNKHDREKVIKNKSHFLNCHLHQKVIDFLLENFSSNLKSIVRALEALVLRSHIKISREELTINTLTVPLAKNLLTDLLQEEQRNAVTPDKIIQKCAEHFGIKSEDLLGKAQSRDCVLPRQIAMHLCRMLLKMPFMKIGDLFFKDHSTVMSSVKVIQKALDSEDREIANHWHSITKKIKT